MLPSTRPASLSDPRPTPATDRPLPTRRRHPKARGNLPLVRTAGLRSPSLLGDVHILAIGVERGRTLTRARLVLGFSPCGECGILAVYDAAGPLGSKSAISGAATP